MKLKYQLDEKPPFIELLIYGLQWMAVTIPSIIVIGKLLGGMQGSINYEIIYLQKLFAVTAVVMFFQVLWGHRFPLVLGPAAVLLIGILSSCSSFPETIYSSILIGGLILSLLGITGLFVYLSKLFTPRVIAVILLLVAFTLTPTIMKLIISCERGGTYTGNITFAFVFIVGIFTLQRHLKGIWKSTLVLLAIPIGSLVYFLVNPRWTSAIDTGSFCWIGTFFSGFVTSLSLDPGVFLAFLLCFLGLAINDLGSIQAMGKILDAGDMPRRISHGITVTGLGNALSGLMGIIGPVNFSYSPGIIASTGCASRYTLIPASAGMLILAFSPAALTYLAYIPEVVIGCILLYIMSTQVAAGLMVAFDAIEEDHFDNALSIGLPLLMGVIAAIMPGEVLASFPSGIKPILGNGFVVGVMTSMLLEHVIFRAHSTSKII